MFWSVCSVKGGVGTSVVAASLSLELVSSSQRVVLIDLCGDLANMLGVDVALRAGAVDWLSSNEEVVDGALEHLLIDVVPGLQLLPCGATSLRDARGVDPKLCTQLVETFDHASHVVVDVGVLPADPMSPHALISVTADRTIAVLRSCYLTLRRSTPFPVDIDGLIEIVEPGRSLTTLDLELVTNKPVDAKLRVDPVIARAVDAGLLARRRPRALRRSIRDLIAAATRTTNREAAA